MSFLDKLNIEDVLKEIDELISLFSYKIEDDIDISFEKHFDYLSMKLNSGVIRKELLNVLEESERERNKFEWDLPRSTSLKLCSEYIFHIKSKDFDQFSKLLIEFSNKISKNNFSVLVSYMGAYKVDIHEERDLKSLIDNYKKQILLGPSSTISSFNPIISIVYDLNEHLDNVSDVNKSDIPDNKILYYNQFIKKWNPPTEMKKDIIKLLNIN